MRGDRIACIALAAALSSPSPALAQAPPDAGPARASRAAPQGAPDAATRKAARILAEEGLALFDRGEYAPALEKFDKADALVSAPTVDLYAARCLAKLGRLVEASERYGEVTRAPVDASAPEAFKEAQANAEEELAALLPRLASIEIAIEGGAAGAIVLLDGREIPAPGPGDPRRVDPGDHKVEARRGGAAAAREVSLREGERAVVTLAMPRPAPAAPPTPAPAAPADPGGAQRTLGWIGIGIGAAGVATWGVTGVLALAKQGSLADEGCSEAGCPIGVDTGAYGGLRLASTIGFWSGLAGLGVGAALLLTAPRATAPRGARIAPWAEVGSAAAAAGVKGVF
jgi:hypothetical protein